VSTVRYMLSPYIKQIRFIFKGLIHMHMRMWTHTCKHIHKMLSNSKFKDWTSHASIVWQLLWVHVMTVISEQKLPALSVHPYAIFLFLVMQHWANKLCFKLRDMATETHAMLPTVGSNVALSQTCVSFKCCKRFREGWTEVESDPRGGQLLAIQNTEADAHVCEPVARDCQTAPPLTGRWCIRFFMETWESGRSAWHLFHTVSWMSRSKDTFTAAQERSATHLDHLTSHYQNCSYWVKWKTTSNVKFRMLRASTIM
jgi:hypothetical protein